MFSKELLTRIEKKLVPFGIWPSSRNRWVTIFNIAILTAYLILVLIKNILNPEGESIEIAFALAFGGLYVAIFCATLILRKEKVEKMLSFLKNGKNSEMTKKEMEIFQDAENDFVKIFKYYAYILPPTVIIRIILPLIELGYNKVKLTWVKRIQYKFIDFSKCYFTYVKVYATDKTFTLPAAQAFPVEYLGEMNVYVIETILSRAYILTLVMGVSLTYILTALLICAHFEVLRIQLENLNTDDPKFIEDFSKKHLELIEYKFQNISESLIKKY